MDIVKEYEARRDRARAQMIADLKAASEGASSESPGPAKVVDAVATGSPALVAYPTAEAYFIDQDIFLAYVENEVNPARLKFALAPINIDHARRCFDIITSGRYRQQVGRQENNKITNAPTSGA